MAGLSENGKTANAQGWMGFENFWVYTKLQANRRLPVASNCGGAGPQQDDLQGARYVRATFADGSKAITADVFLDRNRHGKSKCIFEKLRNTDWTGQ